MAEVEINIDGIDSENWEKRKKKEIHRAQHKRYDFIDQFRGLTVMFLAISWITWQLGKFDPSLVPPILDHGWQFFDPGRTTWNWLQLENQFYTIIDLGSSLFVFILGITAPISFRSKKKKFGTNKALIRVFIRWGAFLGLQLLVDGIDAIINEEALSLNYRSFLLGQNNVLPALGIGTLAAGLSVWLIDKPDKRIIVSIALMAVHGILFLIPGLSVFRRYGGPDMLPGTFFDKWMIPYEAMSYSAIAIAATCFWDWFDKDKPAESIKKRHLPFATYSLITCFIVVWFIPFEHHDLTISQDLLAIGAGYFLLILFFCFEVVFKYKIPLLTALGRNALILYAFGLVIDIIWGVAGVYDIINPELAWLGLVVIVATIAIIGTIGWALNKGKIYLRI